MAIQFNGNGSVTRNERPVTRDVTRVVRPGELALRVEALEREVAELRKLIAERPVQSANSRAAYMREYRKRSKS